MLLGAAYFGYLVIDVSKDTRVEPDEATSLILSLLFIAFCSGLATCASIEIAKRIFFVRGYFHERQLRAWVAVRLDPRTTGRGADTASTITDEATATKASERVAYLDLLTLAFGANYDGATDDGMPRQPIERYEFLDMPIEQLAAVLASVGEQVLLGTDRYPALERVYVGARLADALAGADRRTEPRTSGPGRWRIREPRGDAEGASDTARARAAVRLDRTVEAFQVVVGERWRRSIQWISLVIAASLGYVLAHVLTPEHISVAILISLTVGAFLSWIMRDLAAGIARWRES